MEHFYTFHFQQTLEETAEDAQGLQQPWAVLDRHMIFKVISLSYLHTCLSWLIGKFVLLKANKAKA